MKVVENAFCWGRTLQLPAKERKKESNERARQVEERYRNND
jgi:hypothetical protein